METYTLYYDQKITTWERSTFNIEAESEDEAKDKLLAAIESGDPYDEEENGFMGTETLYEANECMTPQENDGQSTEEITTYGATEPLWSN